jgi:hypothetical protein
MSDDAYEAYRLGHLAAPFYDCCFSAIAIATYPIVLVGGMHMRKLQSRRLAIAASVLAMIPCLPVCILGVPVGLWSLIVLVQPDVRRVFDPIP